MLKNLSIGLIVFLFYLYGCSSNSNKEVFDVIEKQSAPELKNNVSLSDTFYLKYLQLFPDTNRSFSDYKTLSNYMLSLKKNFLETITKNKIQLQFDDSDTALFIKKEFDKAMSILIFKHAQKWSNNVVGISLLSMHSANSAIPIEKRLELFAQFPLKIQEGTIGKKTWEELSTYRYQKNVGFDCNFFNKIEMEKAGSENIKFDTLISSLNKYMILIFGASWCHPCLIQERRLKKIFSDIDTSVVRVAALLIDKNQTNFEKYIRKENFPWQCFRINGETENPFFQKLGFISIPRNFLLDSSGKILKEDLSVFELLKFIKINIPEI